MGDQNKNPLCALSFKLYLKDGDDTCHRVGYLKMDPIEMDTFIKIKWFYDKTDPEKRFPGEQDE